MSRSPKGFGGVIKQKGNRAKPYMVRIQVGMTVNKEKGTAYPKYKILGYTKTKKDGILMLQAYHDNPYDLDKSMTFEEVYKGTFSEFVAHRSTSSIHAYDASFKACEPLHRLLFKDIKTIHLQRTIDTCDKNYPTLRKIKVLLNQMYKYALKYDICNKDYSKFIDITKHRDKNPNKIDRSPFTKEEIDILWSLSNDRYIQIILMLIYTGCRISEFLELKKESISLKEHYFDIIKSKTESGIRRVPIADCIYPFFKEWYNYSQTNTLLCTIEHEPFKYRNYYDSYWTQSLEPLNIYHKPHDTRHTCVSLMMEKEIPPTTIKQIVGHRGAMSLTEKTYTHLNMNFLIESVNKMYHPNKNG